MRNILSLIIFITIVLTSCQINNPEQSILIFKENDGIYQINLSTKEEKCIYKNSNLRNFSRLKPPILENALLTFQTDREYNESESLLHENREYTDIYNSINLETAECWISRKVTHLISKKEEKETVTTEIFNSEGNILYKSDTTTSYINKPTVVTINNIRSTISDRQTKGDKTVFSFAGNIYLTEKKDTIQLTHFEGYSSSYSRGYYNAAFNPSGQYIIFSFDQFRVILKDKVQLLKFDLKTNKLTILKEKEYNDYSFSNDGKFLLFSRVSKYSDEGPPLHIDYYILDLITMNERKIGRANFAIWMN